MYGVYVCVWAHVKMATKTGDITPGLSTWGRGGRGLGTRWGRMYAYVCVEESGCMCEYVWWGCACDVRDLI